ncbi:alpha/beta hydrolase [Spongiibacter sp. KMU-166]|uniref:Alpha/beta hydrolase n=1 Tax=Spongiibacter thalassae TaxID=2721624 RepID=A0ABX1GA71_9GAMM|nr:alpha/beta hydrolase fold domain-containing protein [Spongiibacter thalassae]NKI15851.1 alpha/beta hydrolase [Spongiibacter thalassae]
MNAQRPDVRSQAKLADIPKPNIIAILLTLFLRVFKFFRGNYTVEGLRNKTATLGKKDNAKLPEGLSHIQETISGINCDKVINPGAKFLVLHLYGGAGCIRMPSLEYPPIAKFCARIGAEGVFPHYSLAPEFKFPQGPEDCLAVYKALLDKGVEAQHIILSGASAGGGNVLSLLALLKQYSLPMPACAVMLSPSGDALMVGDSWHENARRDPMFHLSDVLYFQSLIFSAEQRSDPLVNVSLMDSFSGYPPLYFTASSNEVLRDVSTIAHNKAMADKVISQLDIYDGAVHCMQLMPFFNQYQAAWNRIDEFVLHHLPA